MNTAVKGKNEAEKQIIELYENQSKALDQLNSLIIFLQQNEGAIGKMSDPEDFRIYLNSLKLEKQNCQSMIDKMKPYFRLDRTGTQSLAFDTTDPKSLTQLGSLVTAAALSKQGAATSKINYEGFYDRFFRKPSGREKANPKLEKLERMWSAFLKKNPPKDPTLIAAVGSYTIVPTQRSARVQLLSTVILEEILKASQASQPDNTKNILMEATSNLLNLQKGKVNFLERQKEALANMPDISLRNKIVEVIDKRIESEHKKQEELEKLSASVRSLVTADPKAFKGEIKKVVAAYTDMSLEERGLKAQENDSPNVKAALQRITALHENHMLDHAQQIVENAHRKQEPNIFALMMPVKGTAAFVNKANLNKNFPLVINNLRVQFSDDDKAFKAAVAKYNINLSDAKSAIEQFKAFIEASLPAPNFSEASLKKVQRYLEQPISKKREQISIPISTRDPILALQQLAQSIKMGFIPVFDAESRRELLQFQRKNQRDLDIISRYLTWNDSPEAQTHHPKYLERAAVNKSLKENQEKLRAAETAGNKPEVNKLQAKIALLRQKREQLEADLKAEVVFKDEIATLDKKDQILLQTLAHQKNPEGRMSALQQRRKAYGDLVILPITTTSLDLAKLQIQRLFEQGCSFSFTHPKMEKDLQAFLQNDEVVINAGDLKNVVPLFQKALDMGFIPKLGSDTKAEYFNTLKAGRGTTRLSAIQLNLAAHQDPVRALQAILDLGAIPVIPSFLKENQAKALLTRLQDREQKVAKEGQQNVLQIKGPLDNIPHALKIYETILNMGLHPEISDDLAKAIQAEAIKQEALKEKFTEVGVKKGAGLAEAPKAYNPLPELRLKNISFDAFAKLVSLGIWSPTLVEKSGKKTDRYFSESFVKAMVADLKKQFDADNAKTTFFVELPGNSKNDALYKNMSHAVVELGRAVMDELKKGSKKYHQITLMPQDNEKIKLGLAQPKITKAVKPTQQMYGQHLAEAASKRRIPPPPARKNPKIAPDKPPPD